MKYSDLLKELHHKKRTIKDLISYIRTRTSEVTPNYNLFLGAGASRSSGIKTGMELVNSWREEIYLRESTDSEYTELKAKDYFLKEGGAWYSASNEYSSLFEKKFDLASQRRRFVEKEVGDKIPSIGYSYLVSLTNSVDRYFDTIYTTNFDDLINDSFYQFSQSRPIVCAHDSSVNSISISSTRPKVIKLHGDYLFDDIKSTLRETETLETNIKNKLIEFSKEYGLVFVGYAGNDRSIMDVLNFLLKTEDYLKNGIYWCLRPGDYINPDLRKLLWKDKVYFVEIDGFDELMADLHHGLKGDLSLKDNFTDTKKAAIIESFTEDKFQLCKSSHLIKQDIENLKKHKNDEDISHLIRELSGHNSSTNNSTIAESDLKHLLNLDNLMKQKKFSAAKAQAEVYVSGCTDVELKSKYIKKLIKINIELKYENEALELSDQLIALDEFDPSYVIDKALVIKNKTKICEYLSSALTNFDNIYYFHNFYIRCVLDEYESTKNKPFIDFDSMIKVLDKSLKLEPSIKNPAWLIKLDVFEKKYELITDKRSLLEKDELVADIEESIRNINPDHIVYFEVKLHDFVNKKEYGTAKLLLEDMERVFNCASQNKKEKIFKMICDLYSNLDDYLNNDGYQKYILNFLEKESIERFTKDKNIACFNVLKAKYYINVEKDFNKFTECLTTAMSSKQANEYANYIVDCLCEIVEDNGKAEIFVNDINDSISKVTKYCLLSDIELNKQQYDLALINIELAHDEGLNLERYISKKSFILLCSKKYEQTQSFIDMNIEYIKEDQSKDILLVNKELAKKLNGGKINSNKVRNVISRHLSKDLVLCAEALLDRDVVVKRLLKDSINSKFTNLYKFKQWPAIPDKYLAEYLEKVAKTKDKVTLLNVI